jgi:hypothetical protein
MGHAAMALETAQDGAVHIVERRLFARYSSFQAETLEEFPDFFHERGKRSKQSRAMRRITRTGRAREERQ